MRRMRATEWAHGPWMAGWMALAILLFAAGPVWAQPAETSLDLAVPSDYRIAGLTVLGAEFTDAQAVKLFSGLQVGDEVTIRGDRLWDAGRYLWDQGLVSDCSSDLAARRGADV